MPLPPTVKETPFPMLIARLAALSVLPLGARDSKVTASLVAPDLGKQLETVQGCCQHPEARALLDVTETWRLDRGESSFTSAIGLGDVSLFLSEEEGSSPLEKELSGNPLSSVGADLDSDFELSNAEASLVFDVPLEPVAISPRRAADDFDFDLEVTQANDLASELADLVAPMPLAVLPAAADGGMFSGMEEVGHVEADIDELKTRFIDIDATLTVRANEVLDLWVGCRRIEIEWDGQIGDDAFPDITLDGVMLGGGLRF